jgi:hypothetical protein
MAFSFRIKTVSVTCNRRYPMAVLAEALLADHLAVSYHRPEEDRLEVRLAFPVEDFLAVRLGLAYQDHHSAPTILHPLAGHLEDRPEEVRLEVHPALPFLLAEGRLADPRPQVVDFASRVVAARELVD